MIYPETGFVWQIGERKGEGDGRKDNPRVKEVIEKKIGVFRRLQCIRHPIRQQDDKRQQKQAH
jgi:hypothetical protein